MLLVGPHPASPPKPRAPWGWWGEEMPGAGDGEGGAVARGHPLPGSAAQAEARLTNKKCRRDGERGLCAQN